MDSSTVVPMINSAIYCYYSSSLGASLVSVVIKRGDQEVSTLQKYDYPTNRAILLGMLDIFYLHFATQEPITIETDCIYLVNQFNKLDSLDLDDESKPIKNGDFLKKLKLARHLIPNLKLVYVDESLLVDKCKQIVMRKLRSHSIANKLIKGSINGRETSLLDLL